jgi:DNA-binding MarR family transcriptional regulator
VSDEWHRRPRLSTQRATGGEHVEAVTAEDVDWLVTHLRTVVTASPPAVWAGRGMTLLQLTALYLIGALEPVSLTDLARALGTRSPAASVMVGRLTQAGLVYRARDPHNRRRVTLTLTADARRIIGDTGPDTARRLQTVLNGISTRISKQVIDVLRDTVRRSTV